MICSHCKTEIKQNFCPNCGQKWIGNKTTIGSMFFEIIQVMFSLERSVFATFISLLTNPRAVISNYSNGFRKVHASPGKVLFYSLTFLAIHLAFVNEDILSITFTFNETTKYAHFGFLLFFGLLMLLVSGLYFKFKEKTPWVKTIIASLYLLPFLLLLSQLIQDITLAFSNEINMQVPYFILVFLYLSIVLTQEKSTKWYLLNFIFQMIIFMVIILTIFGLFIYLNPDNQTKISF